MSLSFLEEISCCKLNPLIFGYTTLIVWPSYLSSDWSFVVLIVQVFTVTSILFTHNLVKALLYYCNLVVLVLYFCKPFAFYVHFLASYQFVQDVTRMQQWPVYICLKLASNTYPIGSCQWMFATDFKKVPVSLVLHFNKTSSFVVCRHSMCNCYQTANGDCV